MIAVAFDGEAGTLQDGGKSDAEVSIAEEDERHAARSKTTASSTSSRVSP